MHRKAAAVLVLAAAFVASAASAQDRPPIPPENAMKLSQIITTIEQRNDFRYVSEVEWNDDGYYDVIYFTGDKAKVEIKIDAVTGKPR